MRAAEKIRVLLVDDHQMFREGLRELLSRWPDIEVVAEAGTANEAMRQMSARPNVVVLDIRLPDGDGIATCKRILAEHPHTHVVMLTMYKDEDYLFKALKAGAVGYVLKESNSNEIASAIRAASKGQSELDPDSASRLVSEYRRLSLDTQALPLRLLSERELMMVALAAQGTTNREIAEHLALSEQTVKNYFSVLYQKLGVTNRAEAVVAVMNKGIRLPKVKRKRR